MDQASLQGTPVERPSPAEHADGGRKYVVRVDYSEAADRWTFDPERLEVSRSGDIHFQRTGTSAWEFVDFRIKSSDNPGGEREFTIRQAGPTMIVYDADSIPGVWTYDYLVQIRLADGTMRSCDPQIINRME